MGFIDLSLSGNTGLGFETIRALVASAQAFQIFVGCRTLSKGEDTTVALAKDFPTMKSTFSPILVDICSDTSIEEAVQTIREKFGRIVVLINNAGASFDEYHARGKLTLREAFNASWDTNVTGTHVLTTLAAPLLLQSTDPRLSFLTSGTSSLSETERFDEPKFQHMNASPHKGWPKINKATPLISYSSAKTGLNMLMRDWHRVLKNDGVKVWSVSPGFLATNLAGLGPESPRKVSHYQQLLLLQ